MLLIAFGLALLVIVAGMTLLIHTQKEMLGNLYKYISWFVVVMGFLMLLSVCCACVNKMCCKREHMMEKKERMMDDWHHGCSDERGERECCRKMMNHHGMSECHESMMMGKHHGYDKEATCDMYGACSIKNEEEYHRWKEGHEEEAGLMKKELELKKDTVKKKQASSSFK